jgi:magnesium transporter
MVRTRVWRNGSVEQDDFRLEQVSDFLDQPDTFVWVDFTDPSADDLAAVEDELGVHALAAEDAVERGQRPKLDRYRDNLFLVAYDVTCPRVDGDLVTHEVKAFVTDRAIVTMHGSGFDAGQFPKRWEDYADLAHHGVAFLLWGVLDVLTDHAAQTADQLEDLVDALENDLFEHQTRTNHIQRRSFEFRKSLGTLRRLTLPMRDVVQLVLRADARVIPDEMRPYYRDVADHAAGISDTIDELRDAVSSVVDTNLGLASNRQNLVMKKVTSWAAIIAIPTAITGFFGQNVSLPWGGTWAGLALSSTAIVVVSAVLYRAFRRNDWL